MTDVPVAQRDARLPGRLRFGVAVLLIEAAWSFWLLIGGTSGSLIATAWGQTFLLAALLAALVPQWQRTAAAPLGSVRLAPRRGRTFGAAVVAGFYLGAVLAYGFSFRHAWSEVAPWSTGAVFLIAVYGALLGVPWLLWRSLR
ncbi:MAG: hypothetical protein K2R93_21780 [Gemmatimonadaceae bacterium]|nr:hypothetical protein [Gemmatimonadaceae bacterium]